VTGCTSYGISAGSGSVLESCRAHDNSGTAAIFADTGSSLANCIASNNTGGPNYIGIRTTRGGTMSRCTASANTGVGIVAGEGSVLKDSVAYSNGGIGIVGQNGCSIVGCSAQYNSSTGITALDHSTVSGCNISNNDVGGLFVYDESMITGCEISSNKGDGIRCNGYNMFEHNSITLNGAGGTGDGIHSVGFGNRIDSNQIRFNTGAGIRLPTNGQNVVIRNTLGSNEAGNYLIATGNGVGPIISVAAGNLGNATNSPFANIQD
jgi:parallel beta-helix repeat protein